MRTEQEGAPSNQDYPAIEIHLTPDTDAGQPEDPLHFTIIADPDIGTAVNRDEGGVTIFTRGEIIGKRETFTGEVAITIYPPVTESSVAADMPHRSTYIPESPPDAVSEQMSASTEHSETVEGNEKHDFVGNPVFDPSYKLRKSGKRIAVFVLATNPTEDDPGYRRIVAFDGLANYVRKHVRKGQTDVAVTAYGPKHWTEGKKEVTGYYAQKVKVPKRYRLGQKD